MRFAVHALAVTLLALLAPAVPPAAAPRPTGTPSARPLIASGHQGAIQAIVWSPDGRLIASGGDDGTVRLWDAVTGAGLQTLVPGGKAISGLAFSKDSRTLVSWDNRTADFWDTVTEQRVQTLALPDGSQVIGLTPDAQRLVIFADWQWEPILHGSGIVAVLDRRTGRPLLAFPAHGVHGDGTLSPDGRAVALSPYEGATGNSQTVRLWNLATGMPTLSLTAFGDYPLPAWSADGSQLAAASGNGTVNVWEAATGRPLGTCLGTPAQVGAVSGVRTDGRWPLLCKIVHGPTNSGTRRPGGRSSLSGDPGSPARRSGAMPSRLPRPARRWPGRTVNVCTSPTSRGSAAQSPRGRRAGNDGPPADPSLRYAASASARMGRRCWKTRRTERCCSGT